MRRSLLPALVLLALLAPAAAHAGTPITVGEGRAPHLLVDGSGAAHVTWHDETDTIFYCQVPRGGSACTTSRSFTAGTDADDTFILAGGGTTLHIVMPQSVDAKTYLWTSTDNGATWGARQTIYSWGGGTDATEPVLGPQAGQVTFATTNPDFTVWSAKLDGSEAATTTHATLAGGGGFNGRVAPTDDGGLVAVSDDLSNAFSFRMAPGGDPSVQASWSGASPVGPGGDTRAAGGPGGAYMLSVNQNGGDPREEIRKFSGAGFGAPVVMPEGGFINDIFVSPSGTVAGLWRQNAGGGNRLRLALSTDGGGSFATRTIAIEDSIMDSMDVALAADNQGFAGYEGPAGSNGARTQIRVVSTDEVSDGTTTPPTTNPPNPPPNTNPPSTPPNTTPQFKQTTANIGGAQLALQVPGGCIPKTGKFTARLKVKRFPKPGTFRNVKRVDFLINGKRVKRDKKAPFVQVLTIKSPVAGKTYTLKTKASIKRKGKRRLQRKSLSVKITVCA
jgi:hypothetical protein